MNSFALIRAGLLVVAVAVGSRMGAQSVANEPPIELPRFEVVDTRILPPPESWRYAELPGFEILSNVSEGETRRFTKDFALLQEVIKVIMPLLNRGRSDVPTALILAGRGRGMADFIPPNRKDDEFRTNSLFFADEERTAIVVDFALSELDLDPSTRIEADPYRAFYAEYFRFLIRRLLGPEHPAWLEEGLAQLFAGIDFNRQWIHFGLVGDGFGGRKPGDFNELLARRALIPLHKMFTATPRTAERLWAAQCYAFVHMCMYSMDKRYQRPFLTFVSRLQHEPVSEKLFRECFNRTYRQMGVELRGYLEFTAHQYVTFKARKGQSLPEPQEVAVRSATEAEVGRLKGEVMELAGRDDAAHLAMIAPYIRGAKEPRLLAALGLHEMRTGHEDRARKFLEAAAQQQVRRARAYFELARLRYQEATAALKPGAKLDRERVAYVMQPLQVARTQPPPLAGVYATMMDTWMRAAHPPTREEFGAVLEGLNAFPANATLLLQAARCAQQAGYADQAHALVDRGLKVFARRPQDRERFALLSAALARDPDVTVEQSR